MQRKAAWEDVFDLTKQRYKADSERKTHVMQLWTKGLIASSTDEAEDVKNIDEAHISYSTAQGLMFEMRPRLSPGGRFGFFHTLSVGEEKKTHRAPPHTGQHLFLLKCIKM